MPPTTPLPASIEAAAAQPSYGADGSFQEMLSVGSQAHQCMLLYYMDVVKSYHQKQVAGGRSGNNFLRMRMAPEGASVAKIILVNDENTDAGISPINALTSLGKTKSMSRLGSDEIAKLMPSLRLYKIYRKSGVETGKVELIFDNYTDKGFLDGTNSGTAFKSKGRGAGIKSFNWSFIGGDPYTATRDLKATLSIFFQDFTDLTMERSGVNLFSKESKENLPYHLLDLVLQPDCRSPDRGMTSTSEMPQDQSPAYEIHNPECYEIAVEVGYSAASGIPDQTDTLYLTMVEHTFDIGQDGTFELKIEYRARLSNLLGDKGMNVLMPGGGHLIKTSSTLFGSRGNENSIIWDIKATEELIIELERKKDKKEQESVELQELRKLKGWMTGRRNAAMYNGMFTSLCDNDLLYKIKVPEQLYNVFTYYDSDFTTRDLARINQQGGTLFDEANIEKVDRYDDETVSRIGVQQALEEGLGTEVGRQFNDSLITLHHEDFRQNIYFTTLGNIILVALEHVLGESMILPKNWTASERVMLEDLVKEVVSPGTDGPTIDVEATEQALRIITYAGGPEGLIHTTESPGLAQYSPANYRLDSGRISREQREIMKNFRIILDSLVYKNDSGTIKAINLAHLPVSLEEFRAFMTNKVVAPKRNFYSLQNFSKDLLTDIILPSLSRTCFGGYDGKGKVPSAGISLLTAQGVAKDKNASVKKYLEPIANLGAPAYKDNGHGYKTLDPSAADHNSPIFSTDRNNKAPEFSYMMFTAFASDLLNSNLEGNETKDNDMGIMHFGYGHTTGILKSVNFKKTPIEYLAEERYVREGTDNLLNQLAGRYEMDINMVGNSLFIPGQYVYFNPAALGIGKPHEDDGAGNRSLANRMGLGGYHIVTEVGSSISPGKFETTIKALWETGGNMP